jgi:hypothetical protein
MYSINFRNVYHLASRRHLLSRYSVDCFQSTRCRHATANSTPKRTRHRALEIVGIRAMNG